ncbi:MAG: carboxypeptidase-like regulatory domain-containing protein [Bdellovibrionota bacterium]
MDIRLIISIASLSICLNCNNSKSSNSSSSPTNDNAAGDGGEQQLGVSGTLSVQFQAAEGAEEASIANASIEIVGHPEYSTNTDENGKLTLNTLPGTLSIVATSNAGGAALAASEVSEYGIKLDDLVVKPGELTEILEAKFKKTGNFSGKVSFRDNPNNLSIAGAEIYVPGTSFIAKAAEDGSFAINGLPEGSYNIYIDKDGFARTALSVFIEEGKTTDIGSIDLSLSNGPEGGIQLVGGVEFNPTGSLTEYLLKIRTANVKLTYDNESSLMKISDEPTFLNKKWEPVKDTYSWEFTSDGKKSIYVKYSDLNGLESSPYKIDFCIDTEDPALYSISILNGWAQTAAIKNFIDIDAYDSGCGIEKVQISNNSASLSGSSYVKFGNRIDWNLPSSDGSQTVYLKLIDYAGNFSEIKSDEINLDTSGKTIIYAKTYDEKLTLYKDQSPYIFKSGGTPYLFEEDVFIEPGTTIYFDQSLKVTFKNGLNSVGKAGDEIVFLTENLTSGICYSYMGSYATLSLDQGAPGTSAEHIFKHTIFKNIGFEVNGGVFQSNHFDNSHCTEGATAKISKKSLESLVIDGNQFTNFDEVARVQEGDNTSITNNTGTILTAMIQTGTAKNTVFTKNSFTTLPTTSSQEAFIQIENDNSYVYGKDNSVDGENNFLYVGGSVTQNLTFDGIVINGCLSPVVQDGSNTRIITIKNSIINCQSLQDGITTYTGNPNTTFRYEHNTINLSKTMIYAFRQYTTPTKLEVVSNDISIDCGNNTGEFCDLIYFRGGDPNSSGSSQCPVSTKVDATLTGNNISCFGDDNSGCRGFVLHAMEPNQVGTCNFNAGEASISMDGNYWRPDGGSKTIANGYDIDSNRVVGDTLAVTPDSSNIKMYVLIDDQSTTLQTVNVQANFLPTSISTSATVFATGAP